MDANQTCQHALKMIGKQQRILEEGEEVAIPSLLICRIESDELKATIPGGIAGRQTGSTAGDCAVLAFSQLAAVSGDPSPAKGQPQSM